MLSDKHFQLACKNRLGVAPYPCQASRCGGCNASVLNDPWHDLSCVHRRKNELNLRHDLVTKCIKYYAEIAGAVGRLEPNGLSEDDRKRPDLELFLGHIHQLVDVTIVHPTCRSYLIRAQHPLAITEKAASNKLTKYSVMGSQLQAKIIPFAIESFGGFSQSAQDFVSTLAHYASNYSTLFEKNELIRDFISAIAVAVQKGNALAVINGWRMSASAASA